MVEVIKRSFPDDAALGHSGNASQLKGLSKCRARMLVRRRDIHRITPLT